MVFGGNDVTGIRVKSYMVIDIVDLISFSRELGPSYERRGSWGRNKEKKKRS